MDKVRIGIIGLGNMGTGHSWNFINGHIKKGHVTAVCDIDPARLEYAKEIYGGKVKLFGNVDDMLASKEIDGVMIETPHYLHPEIAIKAFHAGLHVLSEKPAGVYTKQVEEMNKAAVEAGKKGLKFGLMFNQRTNPVFQKARELVSSGEIGALQRVNWVITNWFRTEAYYRSGGWRATWAGEGGGVLVNQCPHNLDLVTWICGMPSKVMSFCKYGKYHDIEVEDDVTAYLEYENGATGVFITTTGEAPGSNRLEISGTRGKLVIDNNSKMEFFRTCVDTNTFLKEAKGGFETPETWKCEIPIQGHETAHVGVVEDWCDSIINNTPMLAAGVEGINGVQLANAIHLSSWTNDWAAIPVDGDLYFKLLQEKINNSTVTKEDKTVVQDLSKSFGS